MQLPRWLRARARPMGEPDMGRLLLRFEDSELEARFLLSRRHELRRGCLLLGYGGLAVSCGRLVLLFALLWRTGVSSEGSKVVMQVSAMTEAAVFVANAIYILVISNRFLSRLFSEFQLEVLNAVMMLMVMTALVLSPPDKLCSLMQVDCEALHELAYPSDSMSLLIIQGIFTVAHLSLTMRWCIMLPLGLYSILLYAAVAFIMGSPEPKINAIQNLVLLSCLVMVELLKERAWEFKGRQKFEKSGPQSSLPGSSMLEQAPPFEPGTSVAAADSAGMSALSANVFDPIFQKDANITEQLENIKEMGQAEHWLVNEAAVKLIPNNVLGKGGFGKIIKGIFCNMMVAVKVPNNKLNESSLSRLPDLCNELRVLRYLRHPNIVAFHGAIVNPKALQISLVLELVNGVVLHNFLAGPNQGERVGEPSTIARYQVMLGTCRALTFMHSRQPRIVHGDIKSTNILVELSADDANPKLLDFGLSRVITRETRRLGGTLCWMAPEVYQGDGPVNCSADIYSFGRLLFFTATSVMPVKKMKMHELRQRLQSKTVPLPKWPKECVFQPSCKDLVDQCLLGNQDERPGILEVFRRLICLPQELGWEQTDSHFLQDVHVLASTMCKKSQKSEALGLEEAAKQLEEGKPPEATPKNRLSPLLEDQEFHEGSENVPQPVVATSRSSSSRRSCSSSARERRVGPMVEGTRPFPERPETSAAAVEETVIKAMQRWNCNQPADSCCHWHSNLRMVRRMLGQLVGRPCCSQVAAGQAQCVSCGVLGIDVSAPCDVCGMEQDLEANWEDSEAQGPGGAEAS